MFPRSLRLGRDGIEKSRKLRRNTTAHFSISYGSLPDVAGLGVIVPKKAVKSAVGRHKTKRYVREVLRELSRIPGCPAVMVVAARAGAGALSFAQVRDELSGAITAILSENTPPA